MPWERCIDVHFVHGQKIQKEQKQSYSQWSGEDWNYGQQAQGRRPSRRKDQSGRSQTPRGKSGKDSPRRRPSKGKGHGGKEAPFQPLGGKPPPWPSPENPFSSTATIQSPALIQQQAPLPPPLTPPPVISTADALLVAAVREEYPDLTKAPESIRMAVEKAERAEAMSSQQIAAALHRCTNQVRQTSDKLRQLKESQMRHKESWHVHLKEAINSWEGQIKSYTTQQNSYKDLMEKARSELQVARKEIQRLNHLAAGNGKIPPSTVDLTEPDEIVIEDMDSAALMDQVQKVLNSCAKIILAPEKPEPERRAVSVDSRDEDMQPPAGKRQRSTDAGGFASSATGVPVS